MLKILNFRTLAKDAQNREGKKIKPNTIFRSGVLSYASKLDIQRLKSYGIENIYDFRNREERTMMPALADEYFDIHSFDILEEVANADTKVYFDRSKEELNKGVIDLYSKDFVKTDKYRGVIANIAGQSNPEFLFHCTAGKDRTGIFGAILMMIMDFDVASIKKEYLILSKRSIRIMTDKMLKKAGVRKKDMDMEKFEGILGVHPEFIGAYLETILDNHKSFDLYLEEKVGITPEIKSFFKERYLV